MDHGSCFPLWIGLCVRWACGSEDVAAAVGPARLDDGQRFTGMSLLMLPGSRTGNPAMLLRPAGSSPRLLARFRPWRDRLRVPSCPALRAPEAACPRRPCLRHFRPLPAGPARRRRERPSAGQPRPRCLLPEAWSCPRFGGSHWRRPSARLAGVFPACQARPLSGSDRTRLPVAANRAFAMAGAVAGKPASPAPPISPPLWITWTSILGASAIRRIS